MNSKERFNHIKDLIEQYNLINDSSILEDINENVKILYDDISTYFSLSSNSDYSYLLELYEPKMNASNNKAFSFDIEENINYFYYNPFLLVNYSLKELLFLLMFNLELTIDDSLKMEYKNIYKNNEEDKTKIFNYVYSKNKYKFLDVLNSNNISIDKKLDELIKEDEKESKVQIFKQIKAFYLNHKEENFSSDSYNDLISLLLTQNDEIVDSARDLLNSLQFSLDMINGDNKEEKEKILNLYLKKYTNKKRSKERSISSLDEEEKIERKKEDLSWDKTLRLMVGQVPKGKRHTKTRLNRRQPFRSDLSGELTDRKIHVVIAVDTSYSMEKEQIEKALNQVYKLKRKYDFDLTLIQVDSQIKEVKDINKLSDIPTLIKGRGGTSFTPVIEYVNSKKKYRQSILVYFTDGRGDYKIPKPLVKKVIWVLFPQYGKYFLSLSESYGIIKKI